MTLVITLPGVIGSKAQMVLPRGGVRPRFQSSQRLLDIPGGCSVLPEVALQSRRLDGFVLMKVACLGLFSQKSLALACSGGGHCLGPASTVVTGRGLDPWRLITWTCAPKVAGASPIPQRLLGRACSLGGPSLIPALEEVTGSGLLWQRLLTCAGSLA